jgi:hypothetical protein
VPFEGSYVWVTLTQDRAFDVEHLAVGQRGPVMVASLCVECCQVVLDDRDLVMLLPKAVSQIASDRCRTGSASVIRCCSSSRAPRTARSLAVPVEAGPSTRPRS